MHLSAKLQEKAYNNRNAMSSTVELMHKKYSNKSINYYLRVGPSTTYALYPTNDIAALRKKSFVAARFCEGGHICTLPRECCTQGCCPPPYQSGPRQLPPASEHVLNLFFISHWFFWCVVVAVILAVLCAYSLWKKRRTLCGWGFNEHHVQSEGDSAGSCYAPPQYSRCNSFHHPPPPYTEVTSKPDLYPLVFTCNSENSKNGSSYLMVQYFRNYIVRPPAGSLSAASTVDSLSSSFICNVNEANTIVPPPYSRAASPEIGYSNHFQQHYMLPRSASQLVGMNTGSGQPNSQEANLTMQQAYDQRNSLYTAVGGHVAAYDSHLLPADSYMHNNHDRERHRGRQQRSTSFMQAAGVPRYMVNSNSSISDIFVNGALNSNTSTANQAETVVDMTTTIATSSPDITSLQSNAAACIQTNPLHRLGRHSVSFSSHSPLHYSRHSVEGTRSLAAESTVAISDNAQHQDIAMLRRSLESCRQLLQRQQYPETLFRSMDTPELSLQDPTEYTYREAGVAQSLINSLASIEGATGEVKEILEQIRQLQEGVSLEEVFMPISRPMLQHTMSTPTPTATKRHSSAENNLQRCLTMPTEQQQQKHASTPSVTQFNSSLVPKRPMAQSQQQQPQPQTTYSSKKKFHNPKPNKALYIPMVATNGPGTPPSRCILKSPVNAVGSNSNFFLNRGRGRKVWVSRSAPSTPGTCLPPNCFGDDSPLLLNEHEEDQEGEQNAELEHV